MSGVPESSTWAAYRRLLGYARPYKLRLAIAILAGLVGGGSLFGIVSASQRLFAPFEQAAPAEAGPGDSVPQGPLLGDAQAMADRFGVPILRQDGSGRISWQFFLVSIVAFPLLVVLRAVAIYVNRYYMRWTGGRIVRDLRSALFDRLQQQSLAYFGRMNVGNLISRCTNDAGVIESLIATTAADMVRAPIEIAAALAIVVFMAVSQDLWALLGVVLVAFPLCILPVIVLGRRVRMYSRNAFGQISELYSRMHENFTGIRVVKAYAMEAREAQRFNEVNTRYFRSCIRALRAELMMMPLMEAVGLLFFCFFLVYCHARGVQLSQLIPIGAAGVIAYRPLKQMAQLNSHLQRGAAALERIYAILDADTALIEAPRPVKVSSFEREIVFDGVGFSYHAGGPPTLTDIGFTIPRGAVVAVVGQTGSGKTTLANLLARFYDPDAGRVLLDGVDLRELEIASLRRLIGVVTQDTILFNDTIEANIRYGSGEVPRAAVMEAARQANAHAFIMAAPAGYDHVVGDKGFMLSGGEKQRIALARAILKNPPILILDEATSALDTVTEHLVQEAIARVMRDRTVFAIAHRLSTVRKADLILIMEGGRIVERGTHDELHRAQGHYRRLCDMQMLDS